MERKSISVKEIRKWLERERESDFIENQFQVTAI